MKVALLVLLAACTVDRKTDGLKCTVASDCADSSRVCNNGYCVVSQGSDSCPDHCATCDTSASPPTCVVVGTNGDDFQCPSGFACTVTCGASAKCGDITCANDAKCTIVCDGNSCGDIQCSNACACDVTCGANACQNNAIHCPHSSNDYCTADQTDGPACTSAAGGHCNSC